MNKSKKSLENSIGIITGGFDPLHKSHLDLFKEAKTLVEKAIVYTNSDAWLIRKKGKFFMDQDHRNKILESIKTIDEVYGMSEQDDLDGSSNAAIRHARKLYPLNKMYFINGGDRTKDNIPEIETAQKLDVELLFGIGGDTKGASSSSLLSNWSYESVTRKWGSYKVLSNYATLKVKELNILPGCSISKQYHQHRTEDWYIVEGQATIFLNGEISTLKKGDHICVTKYMVHKISNNTSNPLKIIEVQTGTNISEEDIIRLDQ